MGWDGHELCRDRWASGRICVPVHGGDDDDDDHDPDAEDKYLRRLTCGRYIGRLFWSKMVTLLSFVINILMLATWNARASLHDTVVPKSATKVPDDIYE